MAEDFGVSKRDRRCYREEDEDLGEERWKVSAKKIVL